jgi:diphthamide synthase subunit DPH2
MIIKKTQLENKKIEQKNQLTTNEPESEIISRLKKGQKRKEAIPRLKKTKTERGKTKNKLSRKDRLPL